MKSPKWVSQFKKYPNQRVLVMLSGGKDSALCLALLKKMKIDVAAIHFKHQWMWRLSTKEAKKIAKKLGVKLYIFDVSKDFFQKFNGFMDGRPCRLCKPIMYKKTLETAIKNNFSWICVGDNKYDTVVERIRTYEKKRKNNNLFIAKYLDCINEGAKIPKQINILRPIIDLSPQAVAKKLSHFKIKIEKNFETGDKYFKYWREGCPMQYNEAGAAFTRDRMNKLYRYNLAAVIYGKKYGFRVSVHLPSLRIVTIPRGHEKQIKELLNKKFKLKVWTR